MDTVPNYILVKTWIIKILEIMVVLLFGLLMLFIATYIILLLYNVGKYIIYKIEQKVINKKK